MTQAELAAHIEKEIKEKGGARVPMRIIQEALAADTRVSTTLDAALEEFASSHGWHTTPRPPTELFSIPLRARESY